MNRPRLKGHTQTNAYHVMCRTCQRLFLIEEPKVKAKFWDIILHYAQVYYVDVLAWTLMSNHYHLCLRVYRPEIDAADLERRHNKLVYRHRRPQPWQEWRQEAFYTRLTDLSCFVRDINREMAKWYNRFKNTSGHLWGARFTSILIEQDRHELDVMSYIEHNSVRAGLAVKPTDYPWCSANRIKEALLRGEIPSLPPIGPLAVFTDQDRPRAYVALIELLSESGSSHSKIALPTTLVALPRGSVILAELQRAVQARAPANWHDSVYGSDTFRKNALRVQKGKRRAKLRAPINRGSPRSAPTAVKVFVA